ncbi:response regulator [Formosa sp. A9]|uniref:response regulator n=1 Tax=Formosa sp. A9 TaxID=3442641 RepID=UPI003EBE756F
MPTTIVIADDHPLLLNGTKTFLESKWFKILDTATDGNSAYNKIASLKPDVAILDFDMPKLNGLEVALEIKRNALNTKVIILTLHKQEAILNEVGKTIEGYLTKDSALEELESCLERLKNNGNYIGSKLKNDTLCTNSASKIESLTPSEVKILKYLDQHYSSSQIAEELFISRRTVEKHRSNIIKKLELNNTNQNALFIWLKNNPDIFNT